MARIERIVTHHKTGRTRTERVAIITSRGPKKASPADLLQIVRGHWTIENQSHWIRDVTFDEDRSQIRTGSGPRMMAILRNFAISLIRLLGFPYVPLALRFFGQRPRKVLDLLRL